MKKRVVSRVSGPAAGTCTFFFLFAFRNNCCFFFHVVWSRPMFADVVVWYKAVGRKSGSFLGLYYSTFTYMYLLSSFTPPPSSHEI